VVLRARHGSGIRNADRRDDDHPGHPPAGGSGSTGRAAHSTGISRSRARRPGGAADREDQALIYRLSGDRNPLHSDPWFAKEMADSQADPARAVHLWCGGQGAGRRARQRRRANITSIASRFTSPVFPGETLTTLIWRTEPGKAVFRTVVAGADGADPGGAGRRAVEYVKA